ncbi:hypothetical protein [Intrasporangium sp.]|uniref:hypothetical protein n=1 Tax=Intrasporangium sp. TaxID=1925024 RepID=UPI002D78D7EB|nr:hypothetical protein [Intrasporangium sp.]
MLFSIDPEVLERAAGEVAAALHVAVALRIGAALEGAAPALPGGLTAGALPELASRWRVREVGLARVLGSDADLLAAAAAAYRHVEGGTVSALSRFG